MKAWPGTAIEFFTLHEDSGVILRGRQPMAQPLRPAAELRPRAPNPWSENMSALLDQLSRAIDPQAYDDAWWSGKAHLGSMGQDQAKKRAAEAAQRVIAILADQTPTPDASRLLNALDKARQP